MENRYLQILELQPGATKAEIKAAYRRLSKKYHPDVSKDADAKERFIEVNEAYNFLTQVGPYPHRERVAYNYNPQAQEYEQRRRQAREYARAKAREAERRQTELIKTLLFWFNRIAVVVFVFNLVLSIDILLPLTEAQQVIERKEAVYRHQSRYSYNYDDVYFTDYRMRFEGGQFKFDKDEPTAVVYSTSVFHKPMSAKVVYNDAEVIYHQHYNVYQVFGFMIPLCLGLLFLYRFVMKTLDPQLTVALFLLFLFSFQVYLFFRY